MYIVTIAQQRELGGLEEESYFTQTLLPLLKAWAVDVPLERYLSEVNMWRPKRSILIL